MKPLLFSEASLQDLHSILQYIARDKPQAAVGFVGQLEKQCELLRSFPDVGTRRDDLAAQMRVFSFRGYGIYFRSHNDGLIIERVLPPGLDVQKQAFN